MKKTGLLLFVITLMACSSGSFDQMDYYKNDSKFRVFVFHTVDTNWQKINEHGNSLMNTTGCPTVAYYYTDFKLTPVVSNAIEFETAVNNGLSEGCVAMYWKKPNGKVVFEKHPKE